MATNIERVLATLRQWPDLDDDELARRAGIMPRQQVNQICRALAASGKIIRERGPRGKIINRLRKPYPKSGAQVATGSDPTREPQIAVIERSSEFGAAELSEDNIKKHLAKWLESAGWGVTIAWGNARGIDIIAERLDDRWIIEAKGIGSRPEMRVNYFLAILGQLLQRMNDSTARYSIALPDVPQFRGLWQRLPAAAKGRLCISALFVNSEGMVLESLE